MVQFINHSNNYYCELKSITAIRVHGEQADSYLQGQISVNIDSLTEANTLFACHCDFKGKMWNANYLVRHAQGVEFVSKQSALPQCLAELKKYAVFSKVELDDVSDSTSFWGMSGAKAKVNLKSIFPSLSDVNRSVISNQYGWVITLSNNHQTRYLCALKQQSSATNHVFTGMLEEPEALWDALDISDGIPCILATTNNEYVPQMLNMQALDAIDFKKGCYMGQEVVARTKYLGKNKRATYLLMTDLDSNGSGISVAAGDMLEKSVGENWRRGGKLVHTSQYQSVLYALAVLSKDTQVDEILRLKDYPEICLTVGTLPYTIDA